MQQKSELPEGWAEAKVSDICHLINGRAFKPKDWSDEGLPIVRIQNLNNIESKFNYCNFDVDSKYYINSGQLLFAWSGTPGTSFGAHIWDRGQAVLNQHIFRVEINEQNLNKFFLKHLLNYNVAGYIEKAHGTSGLAHITKGKFEESLLAIPPLPEQHRIVAAIEALFARLDATNERLDRVPEIMRAFRQVVLAAACDGRLTEEWRKQQKDLPDANELLEQIRREKIINSNDTGKKVKPVRVITKDELDELPKLPEGWTIARMEELSTKVVDGVHKKPNYVPSGVPFITVRNLTAGKGISFENLNYITSFDHKEFCKRANPELGDILITKDGTLGVVRVIKTDKQFSIFVSVAMMKPIKKYSNSDYLKYFLESPIGQKQATNIGKGSGLKHLHLENLREMVFYLPSLPEQQEIIRRIDALFAFADSIETKVAAAREKTEQLRQSILTKAFSGELVPTEAEIAKQEGREYESAEELLERIKAEMRGSRKKLHIS